MSNSGESNWGESRVGVRGGSAGQGVQGRECRAGVLGGSAGWEYRARTQGGNAVTAKVRRN